MMAGWTQHAGMALSLPLDNIDTDQLIPARFMSVPRSEGYGAYLLHDLRRNQDGALRSDFPLNAHPAVSVLIAGRNFGSGSSREAAVYALVDAGIRAVIAPSFGDIFSANAVNNGLLPLQLCASDCAALEQLAETPASVSIDLEAQSLSLGDRTIQFTIEDSRRQKLINGWDDIDLTLTHKSAIAAFRDTRHQTAAWAWPNAAD